MTASAHAARAATRARFPRTTKREPDGGQQEHQHSVPSPGGTLQGAGGHGQERTPADHQPRPVQEPRVAQPHRPDRRPKRLRRRCPHEPPRGPAPQNRRAHRQQRRRPGLDRPRHDAGAEGVHDRHRAVEHHVPQPHRRGRGHQGPPPLERGDGPNVRGRPALRARPGSRRPREIPAPLALVVRGQGQRRHDCWYSGSSDAVRATPTSPKCPTSPKRPTEPAPLARVRAGPCPM